MANGRFAMPIPLRRDFQASQLRLAARRTKDGPQARRLLALAAIYEGATRSEAARIGGVTLQIVRDWVLKFNAQGPQGPDRPQGAWTAVAIKQCASGCSGRDRRERSDPGGSWGRALAHCRSVPVDV